MTSFYESMILHSPALWTVHPNGVVCQGKTMPSRDELIADFRSIATYTPTQTEKGARWGEPRWPTEAEAEWAVERCIPLNELAGITSDAQDSRETGA